MSTPVNKGIALSGFEFSALRVANNYRRMLAREFTVNLKGRVIEIGSGIGQMTQEFRNLPDIEFLQSVEPDPTFYDEFKKVLPGQPLIEGTIYDIRGDEWDAIISINVLEHIERDQEELGLYAKILSKRKGTLNLFVPARPEIYAPIDKDFGHFRRYTRKDIIEKLGKAGFTIEYIRYYNFVGYFAWWWKFCVLKARQFKTNEVRFYDKIIFPIVYFIESHICRPPIGQNLIVIARAK